MSLKAITVIKLLVIKEEVYSYFYFEANLLGMNDIFDRGNNQSSSQVNNQSKNKIIFN